MDYESTLLGHGAALWVATLGGVAVVLRALGPLGSGAVVRWLLVMLAGAAAAGLVWAVQAFASTQWWSAADLAEGVSLVLLVAMAVAMHARSAPLRRVFIVVALLGAVLASGFRLPCATSEVVHQWPAGGPVYAGWAVACCACAACCARGAGGGCGALLGATVHLGAVPRAVCAGTAVLWPYGVAVVFGGRVWASFLVLASQLLV